MYQSYERGAPVHKDKHTNQIKQTKTTEHDLLGCLVKKYYALTDLPPNEFTGRRSLRWRAMRYIERRGQSPK